MADIQITKQSDFDSHKADKVHIGNNPSAQVGHNVPQSIANGTPTVLALNTEVFDNDTMHDNTTSNSRFTCNTDGKYFVEASVAWGANTTGQRFLSIFKNGGQVIRQVSAVPDIGGQCQMQVCALLNLSIGDYVEIRINQSSGGSLDVSAISTSPFFSIVKVG